MSRGALDMVSPRATRKFRRILHPVRQQGQADLGDLVDNEVEGDDDPEVRSGAAQRPEQLSVLALAGHHNRSVCENDPRGDEMVDRQTVSASEQSDATGGRKASDSNRAGVARRQRPSARVQRGGHLRPTGARADADAPCLGIEHFDRVQVPEVDHDSTVVRRAAAEAVAAASDAERQMRVSSGEADGVHDLLDRAWEQDDPGSSAAEVGRRQLGVRGIARQHRGAFRNGRSLHLAPLSAHARAIAERRAAATNSRVAGTTSAAKASIVDASSDPRTKVPTP